MSIVDNILRREGSEFTNRKSDRGGATKFGITQTAWDDHFVHVDIQDINSAQAREFYERIHIAPFNWIIDEPLKDLVVDCGVNHGVSRATKWLQEVAKVEIDGIIGEQTKHAVNTKKDLYKPLLKLRFRYYAFIASDQLPADPDLPNLRGWINRALEFI